MLPAAEPASRSSAVPDARERACWVLDRADRGPFLDGILDAAELGDLSPRDRALVTELVYGVLRQRAYLDQAIRQSSRRPQVSVAPAVMNVLRIGAYQLLFLTRVPASAAVNESVRLAKAIDRAAVAGFVNAVLRQVARRPAVVFPDASSNPVAHLALRFSHPEWLVARWYARLGFERCAAVLEANNRVPMTTLRVNLRRTTVAELRAAIEAHGLRVDAGAVAPASLRLIGPMTGRSPEAGHGITGLPGYAAGWFYVQDEAAQLVSLVLGARPGERVLDVCSAPGGKTTHIAELMRDDGEIVALDVDPTRLARVAENAARLGHTCIIPRRLDLVAGDAATAGGSGGFDRILVDAPCSGLGLLRRHPEARWHKPAHLVARCAARQRVILDRAAPLLKAGGTLVYSTCTTEPEENAQVIDAFLVGHPEFRRGDFFGRLPAAARGYRTPRGDLDTFGNDAGMDHFFVAGLTKDG